MSNTTHNGGPAFPACNEANVNETMGMSLRDWFAGQALSGMLAFDGYAAPITDKTTAEVFADSSYEIADAMLKAREET